MFDGPRDRDRRRATTFKNYSLVNGTTYYYTVAGKNMGGEGPRAVSGVGHAGGGAAGAARRVARWAGNGQVTLSWSPSDGAVAYNVYRGTVRITRRASPLRMGVTASPFVDTVANGPTYFYKVTAYNAGGESPRSAEASASPEAPAPPADAEALAAFRFLRQATWGPRPGDVSALVERTASMHSSTSSSRAPMSVYPDTLFSQPVEMTQEHFMHLALTGPDQLRQRVAWALHKIWVVSAIDIDNAGAIVTYQRLLMNGAFGNYRDLMRNVTLNPAMGRYLNMLNNRSQRSPACRRTRTTRAS